MTTPIIVRPRMVLRRDGDKLCIRLQDESARDVAVLEYDLEFVAKFLDELQGLFPDVEPEPFFRLNHDTLG